MAGTRAEQARGAHLSSRGRDGGWQLTDHAGNQSDTDSVNLDAPPAGTAVVRPQRHVIAVRERHAEQLSARPATSPSRSARAWSWILGETSRAPVTDRVTDVPPSRAEVEAEIAEADRRRLSGGGED